MRDEKHEKMNGTTCVRKMDTSIIRASKRKGGICRAPSRKIPKQLSASLVALLLVPPCSCVRGPFMGKRPICPYLFLSEHAPPKTWGSAAIVWPRTYLSKHVPSYLSRAAPQLVSPRERTNLPPFPPISHCCRDLLVGGRPPTIFDTHGNCMVGRRFGGPAGAPCSPGPERLGRPPIPSRSPRNDTPTPDREMHRLRVTHPPAYLPPLPRSAALSMAKLTAPSRK